MPRLLLWLALCGLWRGGEAGTLPARGAALPFGAGSPAACSPRCQHGGLCLGNGTCLCSKGYEGERCQHGNGPASPCGRGAPGSRWVGRPAGRSGVRPRGDGRKKRGQRGQRHARHPGRLETGRLAVRRLPASGGRCVRIFLQGRVLTRTSRTQAPVCERSGLSAFLQVTPPGMAEEPGSGDGVMVVRCWEDANKVGWKKRGRDTQVLVR